MRGPSTADWGKPKESVGSVIRQVAIGLPSMAAGGFGFQYFGVNLLVLIGFWLLFFIGAVKLFPQGRKKLAMIFALGMAQVCWTLLAMAVLGNYVLGAEMVPYIGVIALFCLWPNPWTLAVLIVYEGLYLILNSLVVWRISLAELPNRAIILHIALRLLVIAFAILAYRSINRTPEPGTVTEAG